MRFVLIGLIAAAAVCIGQPKSLSAVSTAAPVDFGSATSTRVVKVGTSAPGTCTVGDLFFDSDATAGSNFFGCTATNTWTLLGGAGGSSQAIHTMGATQVELGAGGGEAALDALYNLKVVKYTNASTEHATWFEGIPAAWTGVAPAVRIFWTNAASNSSNTYKWELTSSCDASGSGMTYNTAAVSTVNDTTTAFVPSITSSTLPITGCSAGDIVRIRVKEGTTYTSTANHYVYGIEVIWPLTP